jgi:predicted ribosome quality control (RQC) complex YloA/Tae2 family protein
VSNAVRYDPPLARALAAELHARLAGRLAHPSPVFDRDLSATLFLDRGECLRFDLHPARGWIRILSADARECESAKVPPGEMTARVVRVGAPPDERLLRVDLHEGGRFRGGTRALVVELHTNQWNALLVDGEDRRIVSVLRAREAGGRVLRAGEVYRPPEPQRRFGAQGQAREAARDEWMARLGPLPPPERRGELLRSFAGTSPLNAAALLGDAAASDDREALERAFARWWALVARTEAEPVLLEVKSGPQPYPAPLEGIPCRRFPSLLAAMEAVEAAGEEDAAARDRTGLLERARRRLEAARRRVERLRAERANVGEAERLRARGDLLLAHLHLVPTGAAAVTLPGFDGGEVEVPLDPALRPHENAERWYEEARRRSRAEERLPELIEGAEAEAERWGEAVRALEAGEAPEWVEAALRRAEAREPRAKAAQEERRPFRVYRTSGGLEVRVGRTSRDNDRLTFGHAAPGDVWLHARQVPGSHVVLRWPGEGAPPARDLEEAAVLAALHSKARSSGTVAVDWTRRRYVRKPRGAPPGRVTLLQAKTIFVEPDPMVEEKLRET